MVPTAKEINIWNGRFWAQQDDLMHERMTDAGIREIAFVQIKSESLRNLPVYYQTTLEAALEDAAIAKRLFLGQLARKGGSADKSDALQKLILQLVKKNPDITETRLRKLLTRERYPDLICDVEGDVICFSNGAAVKTASVMGLKDRLSRAKKKIRSR